MSEMSAETQEMLSIMDEYERGDVNLEEAVAKISQYAPLGDNTIAEILMGVERENVLKFPEPRFEEVEPEDDESCSKAVFSFTAEFDLDDPA